MFQYQDQSLRQQATAHLAQTMALLALANGELQEKVLEELNANPALELLEERICPNCRRRLPPGRACPRCSAQTTTDEPVVYISPRDSFRPAGGMPIDETDAMRDIAAPEDLPTYVLQQLAATLLPEDRQLAAYILSSLDDDGFLPDPMPIIARATRSSLEQVRRVVTLIAHSDPPGLATEGPRDALMVQLDVLGHGSAVAKLAREILQHFFKQLGRHEYETIARQLETSVDKVRKAAAYIQENLNPFPARAFWGSGRHSPNPEPTVYHVPDIQISTQSESDEGPLAVEIFSAISGHLRVSPIFRKALQTQEGESQEEWREYLNRASLFVKCLQQRNNTMRQLMKHLASEQREFITQGNRHLKPMTRARVADILGVHESTVSRAVSSKAVALPDGRIIPLARFFDRSLPVRDRIREIVEQETRPLTDDEISEMLKSEGIDVARRTVAKYRSLENILPARLRQRSEPAVHGA